MPPLQSVRERRIFSHPGKLAFAGCLLFVVCGFLIKHSTWSIWANTIGASLVTIAVTNGFGERLLSHHFSRNIGRVSYSLYLFQLPVTYVAGALVGRFFEPSLSATIVTLATISVDANRSRTKSSSKFNLSCTLSSQLTNYQRQGRHRKTARTDWLPARRDPEPSSSGNE